MKSLSYFCQEVLLIAKKKKKETPQFSPYISGVCRMMEDAVKDYTWSREEVNQMDRLTQDYLHKLELDELDYSERAKVATKLMQCRQLRREHKDTAEILEPLVQFLDSDKGKNMMNLLREALGRTRKAEERMENRVYHPRVLTEDAS